MALALLIAAGFLVLLASPKLYKLTKYILERRKWNKSLSSDIWGFWNGTRGNWTGILISPRNSDAVPNVQSKFRRTLSHCRKIAYAINPQRKTGDVYSLPKVSASTED